MTRKQKKNLIRILIAAALLVGLHFVPVKVQWVKALLYLIPYAIIGYDIVKKAVKSVINRQAFDENFLMAVATIGAYAVGEYSEAVAVMLFYQIGELFQSYAVGKSRRSISSLMNIRPDYANIENAEGKMEKVDPDTVPVGSVIVVYPGEKVPIDGVVVEGTSSLNTSALTGESLPRDVSVGSEVISGCVNQNGLLKVKTTKGFGESTASKILDLVENSSMKKARSENFITKFARVYTPAVCFSALVLAIVPPLVRLAMGLSPAWTDWIMRALTFLVISCPCALVISIPLSFFAGIGGSSREGILIKGSTYLETLARTTTAVFDKTGTMTKGVFEVVGVHHNTMPAEQLLEVAALAEAHSTHPISQSLLKAYGKAPDLSRIGKVEEIGGRGILAEVDGHPVAVGNSKLMEQVGAQYMDCSGIGTVVHVAVDGKYCGHILISDVIKPHAAEAVAALKKAGVSRTVMLTGDSKKVGDLVGEELGITDVYSELLPGDKVSIVEKLLAEKNPKDALVFAGDGINDAPVLARADVGIAMGALGSDAAIEAADVVLMDDDPLKIAKAIRIARKTMRIVYENIYFAILVKLVCLVLSALGLTGMWLAVFADVGVMVIAVLNAIRALYVKKV